MNDMTGHTALLFVIVTLVLLCAIGVIENLLQAREHERREKALAGELKRRARETR